MASSTPSYQVAMYHAMIYISLIYNNKSDPLKPTIGTLSTSVAGLLFEPYAWNDMLPSSLEAVSTNSFRFILLSFSLSNLIWLSQHRDAM